MKIKATIVTGNRNLNNHIYTREAMKQIAEKVVGVPVRSSFGGLPIGRVEKGTADQNSVSIEMEVASDVADQFLEGRFYCVPHVTVLPPIDDGVIRSIEYVNSVFPTMEPADSHLKPITKIEEKT